jgi:hypothetical protein
MLFSKGEGRKKKNDDLLIIFFLFFKKNVGFSMSHQAMKHLPATSFKDVF